MLHITYDGTTITPMRRDNPVKTYSSSDIPSGTASVFYRAGKYLRHSLGKDNFVVNWTDDQIESEITTRMASIDAKQTTQKLVDPNNHNSGAHPDYIAPESFNAETMVLIPTTFEIQAKIDSDRGFSDADVELEREKYWDMEEDGFTIKRDEDNNLLFTKTTEEVEDLLRATTTDNNNNTTIVADTSDIDAKNAIIDVRKRELVTDIVNVLLVDNAITPPLGDIISTGSATASSGTDTVTDNSADFVTDGVAVGDFVKIVGSLYTVASVTDANNLVVNESIGDIIEAQSYTIIHSPYMAQFTWTISV